MAKSVTEALAEVDPQAVVLIEAAINKMVVKGMEDPSGESFAARYLMSYRRLSTEIGLVVDANRAPKPSECDCSPYLTSHSVACARYGAR